MSADSDLRYIKVEQALRAALLEILEHKRLEDVTVSEICKLARCSRNAFYGHYAGRDELCAAMLDDFAATIRRECEEENERLRAGAMISEDFVHAAMAVFRENEQLLRVLLRSDTGVFAATLANILFDVSLSTLENLKEAPLGATTRLSNAYIAGGTVAFIERWIKEDLPVEEVAKALEAMHIPTSISMFRLMGVISDDQAPEASEGDPDGATTQ